MEAIDPVLLGQAIEFVKEGDVVWDVGANLGFFSFAAASLAGSKGRIYAFEPDPWLVHALRQSAKQQPTSSSTVTVIPAAVAAENALRSFAIGKRARASSHLIEYGHSQTGGTLEKHTVVTLSLDWLLKQLPPPRILKIDVEGAEVEVLNGAKDMFERIKPIVLCEVGHESSASVTAFFHARGYELFDGEQLQPSRKPRDAAPWATIAVPK